MTEHASEQKVVQPILKSFGIGFGQNRINLMFKSIIIKSLINMK